MGGDDGCQAIGRFTALTSFPAPGEDEETSRTLGAVLENARSGRQKINTRPAPDVKAGKATNSRMEDRLERSNCRSKTKRATLSRDAIRHVRKKRSFLFKRIGRRGDPDKMPSYGTRPWGRGDDAASRGGKIMTSKRRKLPNRRSCFFFRIECYGSRRPVRRPFVSHDTISAELDDRLAARTEFQCK